MKMESKDIKLNHWYMISQYGYSVGIKGKAVDVCGEYVTLSFYWGCPWRSRQVVKSDKIIEECNKPMLFGNH